MADQPSSQSSTHTSGAQSCLPCRRNPKPALLPQGILSHSLNNITSYKYTARLGGSYSESASQVWKSRDAVPALPLWHKAFIPAVCSQLPAAWKTPGWFPNSVITDSRLQQHTQLIQSLHKSWTRNYTRDRSRVKAPLCYYWNYSKTNQNAIKKMMKGGNSFQNSHRTAWNVEKNKVSKRSGTTHRKSLHLDLSWICVQTSVLAMPHQNQPSNSWWAPHCPVPMGAPHLKHHSRTAQIHPPKTTVPARLNIYRTQSGK